MWRCEKAAADSPLRRHRSNNVLIWTHVRARFVIAHSLQLGRASTACGVGMKTWLVERLHGFHVAVIDIAQPKCAVVLEARGGLGIIAQMAVDTGKTTEMTYLTPFEQQ